MASPLQNVYYKRPVATPKACLICHKPTNTVLWNPAPDFLYTCDIHLSDPGFASQVIPEAEKAPQKMTLSEEELKKVKDEWQEKQKRKEEKAKKDKETDAEDKGKEVKDKEKEIPSKPLVVQALPTTPIHQKYILNRQIFAMRVTEQRKRRQATQAKEVAPRLPAVPREL